MEDKRIADICESSAKHLLDITQRIKEGGVPPAHEEMELIKVGLLPRVHHELQQIKLAYLTDNPARVRGCAEAVLDLMEKIR